jgi:hypothetical protein
MPQNNYVFLSYSRQDQETAERLTADLNQRGIKIWRDIEQIEAGTDWAVEIEKGLMRASAMLYISSRHSKTSEWMKHEVSNFLQREGVIIPIVLDDEGAEYMPSFLRHIQWIDLRHGYERALERIVSVLGAELSTGAPVEPTEKKSKGYAFLSYAEEDADFVVKLRGFLKEHGYAYWDYEESERDYHGQLFLELEGVISDAVATLSVLSEAWKRSKWTVKEYFFSEEVGTPVFLLRAKKISPTLATAGVPYIDFIDDVENGFKKLDRELRRKKL